METEETKALESLMNPLIFNEIKLRLWTNMSGRMERFWLLSREFSWGLSSQATFVPLLWCLNISKPAFLVIYIQDLHPRTSQQIKNKLMCSWGSDKALALFGLTANSAAMGGRWRRGDLLCSSLCHSFFQIPFVFILIIFNFL